MIQIYRNGGKRLLDLLLATMLAVLLSPLMLVVFVMVRWKLGSPAIFTQPRGGLHGRHFTLFKFRSMTDARGDDGELLPDELRLTPTGRRIRNSSLDELPQLWNVIRGDMSLVGPRPLYASYIERYAGAQIRRLETRPGITGWAQVNGRNAISWEERFELDVWYVDHLSLGLDWKILAMTAQRVLGRRDISAEGQATMTEFMGTPPEKQRSPTTKDADDQQNEPPS